MRMLLITCLAAGQALAQPAPMAPPVSTRAGAAETNVNLVQDIHTSAALLGLDYSPDGKRIATAGLGRDIVIWDVASAKPVLTLVGHTDDVVTVKFSPNGRYLASGGVDKTLILWDAITGDVLRRATDHTDYVRDVAFSPDSRLVASAGWDGQAIVWETFSGNRVATLTAGPRASQSAVSYEKAHTKKGRSNNMTSVAFNPAGTELLTASGDHSVRGWDTQSWEPKYVLEGHSDEVWDARYSPNGRYVISGAWDNTARVWDLKTRGNLLTVPAHLSDVWGTSFSPDGQLIATCGGDRKVKIWDMATGQLVRDVSGDLHSAEVENVVFAPDGRTLASVSRDGTLKIWRTPTTADRIDAYVDRQMLIWEKKGEYEKTDDYQKRMTTRLKRWEELRQEARVKITTAFGASAAWQCFKLGTYNPDSELFEVSVPCFGLPYHLKASPKEAAALRAAFEKATFSGAQFELVADDAVVLRSVEVTATLGGENRSFNITK